MGIGFITAKHNKHVAQKAANAASANSNTKKIAKLTKWSENAEKVFSDAVTKAHDSFNKTNTAVNTHTTNVQKDILTNMQKLDTKLHILNDNDTQTPYTNHTANNNVNELNFKNVTLLKTDKTTCTAITHTPFNEKAADVTRTTDENKFAREHAQAQADHVEKHAIHMQTQVENAENAALNCKQAFTSQAQIEIINLSEAQNELVNNYSEFKVDAKVIANNWCNNHIEALMAAGKVVIDGNLAIKEHEQCVDFLLSPLADFVVPTIDLSGIDNAVEHNNQSLGYIL